MGSRCNKIYFCPIIRSGLGASGKPGEKEMRAMDKKWEKRKKAKEKEEKRWGLPCFCTV